MIIKRAHVINKFWKVIQQNTLKINVATAAAPVAVIVVFNKFGNKPVIRSS